jgi:hypothetical protein
LDIEEDLFFEMVERFCLLKFLEYLSCHGSDARRRLSRLSRQGHAGAYLASGVLYSKTCPSATSRARSLS